MRAAIISRGLPAWCNSASCAPSPDVGQRSDAFLVGGSNHRLFGAQLADRFADLFALLALHAFCETYPASKFNPTGLVLLRSPDYSNRLSSPLTKAIALKSVRLKQNPLR
jgi:hypothetical protein